jgi:hypothetical protein
MKNNPEWVIKGKTIKELIEEIERFPDLNMEVRISLNDGNTHKPVSIIGKIDNYCVLMNSESEEE